MKKWVTGVSTEKEGKVYVLAKNETGTLRTQAVATTPEIAEEIVKDHNDGGFGLTRNRYLGGPVWMSKGPRCPDHQVRLDLEWHKDNEIMWICSRCRSEDKAERTAAKARGVD